jgi:hypothetical protein
MSLEGFEPTIPVFERTKTVHALDRAATVISWNDKYGDKFYHAETTLRIDTPSAVTERIRIFLIARQNSAEEEGKPTFFDVGSITLKYDFHC